MSYLVDVNIESLLDIIFKKNDEHTKAKTIYIYEIKKKYKNREKWGHNINHKVKDMLSFNQISKRIIQNYCLESKNAPQFFSKSLASFKSLVPCFQNHSFNVYYVMVSYLFHLLQVLHLYNAIHSF